MAQPANTFDKYDLDTSGNTSREDLTDVISNISPTKTPFQTAIGRGTAKNTLHEWSLETLATASSTNFHIDGDDFSADALTDPKRIGNYCGIARKDIIVTRRADKVNKAGMKSALAHQVAKAGFELRRDVESALTANNAAVAGNSTLAPEFAGLGAWLTTNTARGAGGSDGALDSTTYGVPTTAATDGTDRALSEATLLGVIEDCHTAGGNPSLLMVSPTVKQRISNYMFGSSARIATPQQSVTSGQGASVVGSVDVYYSDFGPLEIQSNIFQRDDDVWVLDPDLWEVAYLDGYKTQKIAKSGDSEKRMLLVDLTLCSKNEAGSGVVADIDETTPMVA